MIIAPFIICWVNGVTPARFKMFANTAKIAAPKNRARYGPFATEQAGPTNHGDGDCLEFQPGARCRFSHA